MGKKNEKETTIPMYEHIFSDSENGRKNSPIKTLFKLFKGEWLIIILTTLVLFIQTTPTFIVPLFSSKIIDIFTNAIITTFTNDDLIKVVIYASVIIGSILINIPATMIRWDVCGKSLRRISAGIRCSVVRKLQSLSITYSKNLQMGKVQAKFLRDIESLELFLSTFVFATMVVLTSAIVFIVISIVKNAYVSLFFLILIPLNVFLTHLFAKKIKERNKDYRQKNEEVSAKFSSVMEMMQITKSHGLEAYKYSDFVHSVNTLIKSGHKLDMVNGGFGSAMFVFTSILNFICLLFCCFLAYKKYITIGEIVLYQTMFTSISNYISSIISQFPILTRGIDSINSLSEVMKSRDVEINSGKSPVKLIDGNVTFDHVSYSYPNEKNYVIKDLSFEVKKGECVAFVGSSGSGKTTIMNLIIGFLLPQKGEIRIDNRDIYSLNLTEYRHNISVVSQNNILFRGSIKDNITYGLEHYSDKDLNRVVKMANLEEFLKDLPDGINTDIGEHGDKLSGGQKQRITIARALIRNPRILILDEATSALDNISEYYVQQAINEAIKDRTTFVVAHRLSTIRNAKRIFVMEKGVCVEQGSYKELIKKRGKFYKLKQLNDANTKIADEALY